MPFWPFRRAQKTEAQRKQDAIYPPLPKRPEASQTPLLKTQIWVGHFQSETQLSDFVSEDPDYYKLEDRADGSLSKFASSQGQRFIDHDFLEVSFDDQDSLGTKRFKNHYYADFWRDKVEQECQSRALGSFNSCITLGVYISRAGASEPQVAAPYDVNEDGFWLVYLGEFEHGDGTDDNSINDMITAAENGDADAQAALGGLYILPPPKLSHMVDVKKAEYWLLKAAEAGKESTYNRLYHLYAGRFGPAQPDKAFYWIEKAAQGGSAADLGYLAEAYLSGTGTAEDLVLALKYAFLRCCVYKENSYDGWLPELVARMPKGDTDEAERLALNWIDTHGKSARYFQGFVRNPIRQAANG